MSYSLVGEMFMLSFGQRLADLRREKGFSQVQLAQMLNMGQSTIAMYERDKRSPDNKTLERLADFFNVSVDYLLCLTDTRERPGTKQPALPRAKQEALNKLMQVMDDPKVSELISRLPDLTLDEKESLVEYWDWALKVIEKQRQRKKNRINEKHGDP